MADLAHDYKTWAAAASLKELETILDTTAAELERRRLHDAANYALDSALIVGRYRHRTNDGGGAQIEFLAVLATLGALALWAVLAGMLGG